MLKRWNQSLEIFQTHLSRVSHCIFEVILFATCLYLSDLYRLESPDWKGRAPFTAAQAVFNTENTGDKWYLGKVNRDGNLDMLPVPLMSATVSVELLVQIYSS